MRFTMLGRPSTEPVRPTRSRPRRLLATAVVATLALAVAACAGGGNEPTTPSGPVALRMTMWSGNESHKALFNEIATAYVAANPDKVSSIQFDSITTDYFPTI